MFVRLAFTFCVLQAACHALSWRNSSEGEAGTSILSHVSSDASYLSMELIDGKRRKVPQCKRFYDWLGHPAYRMYKVDQSGYPLIFRPSQQVSSRQALHDLNLSWVHAEPNYTDLDSITSPEDTFVNTSKGYLYRTDVCYSYRADDRSMAGLMKAYAQCAQDPIARDPMASTFPSQGSLLDQATAPVLVGSRTAEGAYYRIHTWGHPVASLEENIEHAPHMFSAHQTPSTIFDGSYVAGWDEVHIGGPIAWDQITLLAAFGSHMMASSQCAEKALPSKQLTFCQQLPKRKRNNVAQYLKTLHTPCC